MRPINLAISIFLIAVSACSDPAPEAKRTTDDNGNVWRLLFDGELSAAWQFDGDHQIINGALVLGGKEKTRAYLPLRGVRNCEIRFQYRLEGKECAGIGWSSPNLPGLSIPHLLPDKDWHDSFVEEYFDIRTPFQRFIKGERGSNGVFAPIETVWIEVPAGSTLFLRNVRQRETGNVFSPLLLAFPLMGILLATIFLWRWRKRRLAKMAEPNFASHPKA